MHINPPCFAHLICEKHRIYLSCDTKNDLPLILKEQFDGNMIGITVLCLEDKNVYMMNGDKENPAWIVL